jgi:hypothetical protein
VLLASTPLSIQATTLISRLPRLVAQRPEPSTLYIYRYTPPPPLPKSPVHHNFSPVVQPSSSCVLARCRGILPLRRRRWCFSPAISSIAGEPSSSSPTSLLPSSPLGERRCWPSPASCCARVPLPCNYRCPNSADRPFGPWHDTNLARSKHGPARSVTGSGRHDPFSGPGMGTYGGPRALARPGPING